MSLKELIEISREYGSDPEYVLANGGNTSWKNDDVMYVKASGISLADIDESGFVQMSREKLSAIWHKTYPEDADTREEEALADLMNARLPGESARPRAGQSPSDSCSPMRPGAGQSPSDSCSPMRPSVEALLHALFPQAFIVHLHPALVNGMTCGKNGRQAAEKLFGTRSVWVPVVNPGYILAKTVKDIIDEYTASGNDFPEIVFMQNHGVFAAADTAEGIRGIYEDIMTALGGYVTDTPDLSEVPAGEIDRKEIVRWKDAVKSVLEKSECRFLVNREIGRLVESAEAFRPISSSYTPDHIVYYGHKPLFIAAGGSGTAEERIAAALAEYRKEYPDNPPRIVAVEGLGMFAAGDSAKRVELMLDLVRDAVKISVYSRSFGGPLFMPKDKIDFIVNWEVEKYRSSMQEK
jgi:rhamnose utilization protein RhaD (predicted bifunctional aldolase and dehydrogenase)